MKKFLFVILVTGLTFYLLGCGKKQASLEEMQEPMSMETALNMNTTETAAPIAETKATPAAKQSVEVAQPIPPAVEAKLEPVPAGPYKPTGKEIQTALKNAGLYTGAVDGKIGPMTKKAIEEFQKVNNLKADGKVGPKTWELLRQHLISGSAETAAPAKKKR